MYGSFFIQQYLNNGYELEEATGEVNFAIDILFGYSEKDFILGKTLNENEISKLQDVVTERLNTHRPLQQILGKAYFFGRKFFVNEYTLIPRPETEILVDEILKLKQLPAHIKVLDIGAGSGCIPVTLAIENPNIIAHSVDISTEAIKIAQKNADFYKVSDKISFFESDLFENVEEKYNIIVSNPPYIPLKDKPDLQIEVRDFDPAEALFTKDEDGIEFYEKIISQAHNYLLENGWLCFELGQEQSQLVQNILRRNNYRNIKVVKDLSNIERILIAQK